MNPNPDEDVTFGLSQVQTNTNEESKSQQFTRENDDVEDEEFTFMSINEKPVIPLFDQSLLCNNEDEKRINEINIKSNSTGGFSNPRRFRDNNNNMYRSNSDGSDAFVFLNPKMRGKEKVKKPKGSALEEYLRRGEEEKKRKSYLTYSKRPQPGTYGLTAVLYVSVKKTLRVASNILSR